MQVYKLVLPNGYALIEWGMSKIRLVTVDEDNADTTGGVFAEKGPLDSDPHKAHRSILLRALEVGTSPTNEPWATPFNLLTFGTVEGTLAAVATLADQGFRVRRAGTLAHAFGIVEGLSPINGATITALPGSWTLEPCNPNP